MSWFKSLSFLFDRRDVRVVMVDDTIINVGSMRKIIYVAFEPLLRKILYVWICDVSNILTSITFLKKIKAIYGSNIIVLSDGAKHYKTSCRILKLKHEVYSLEVKNLMERIIQLRIELSYSIIIYHV